MLMSRVADVAADDDDADDGDDDGGEYDDDALARGLRLCCYGRCR